MSGPQESHPAASEETPKAGSEVTQGSQAPQGPGPPVEESGADADDAHLPARLGQ